MGARERWVSVRDDGTIIMHEENDGAVFLRKGPESVEWVVTLDELKRSYSAHHVKDAEEQLVALARRKQEEKKNDDQ